MGRWKLILALLSVGNVAHGELPADGWISWAGKVCGVQQILLSRADGGDVRQLTFSSGADKPAWAPDGRWISYNNWDWTVHVVRWDGSEDREVCGPGTSYHFWIFASGTLFCGTDDTYVEVQPETGTVVRTWSKSSFTKLGQVFWPNGIDVSGRWLMGTTDRVDQTAIYDNGEFYSKLGALVLLDLNDPQRIFFIGAGCRPTPSPVSDLVVHLNGVVATQPDIYGMRIADLATRASYGPLVAFPDADWGHETTPRISTDGKWLTYAASTSCHDLDLCNYELFATRIEQGGGGRIRITHNERNDRWPHMYVGPLWSRYAGQVVFGPPDAGVTADAATAPGEPAPGESGGGSGCSMGGRSATGPPFWAPLLVALLLVVRRRGGQRRH